MRISDWSSDVCSSDLLSQPLCAAALADFQQAQRVGCAAVLHVVAAGEHDVVAGGEQAGVVQGLHGVARGLARGQAAAVEVDREHVAHQRHPPPRSEEHTSELQSLMRISYAVFCLNKNR